MQKRKILFKQLNCIDFKYLFLLMFYSNFYMSMCVSVEKVLLLFFHMRLSFYALIFILSFFLFSIENVQISLF